MKATNKWVVALAAIVLLALGMLLRRGRKPPEPMVRLPGEDKVLARVNGTPITDYELGQAIAGALGEYSQSQLGKEGRRKMLESLVSARAIALAEEKLLSPERRAALEKKVAAYREQVLVNDYLKERAAPEPVTTEMVKQYYDEHPEKFGGASSRAFEMIFTERAPTESERNALISALKDADSRKDWQKWTEELRKKKHPVAFRDGASDAKLLDSRLTALMAQLAPGKASNLSFIEGRAYVVRVMSESRTAGRPLAEVSGEIRQMLAPIQLKKAVKTASDRALKDVKVEYE
jgi:hypothetical protein